MATRNLHLYRMIGGNRVRVTFEVDDDLNILSETQDDSGDNEQIKALKANGYTFDGNKITHVPPKEQEIFRFFSESNPCWFEGCEELRKRYNLELAGLPDDCPDCHKGALIRKYADKIGAILATP